jgi:hypothetical protein
MRRIDALLEIYRISTTLREARGKAIVRVATTEDTDNIISAMTILTNIVHDILQGKIYE